MDADPPVPELVGEALDDHLPVGGQSAGRRLLIMQIVDQVVGGPVVQPVTEQHRLGVLGTHRCELADEAADGVTQFGRTTRCVALPERQAAGHTRSRRDLDLIMGDGLDPPAGGAEGDHVTDPGLVDHLLVELADPSAGALADQEDAEEATVGDGAAGRDRQPLSPSPGLQQIGVAMPDQPRPQFGEILARIAARQHVQHCLVRAAGEIGEPVGPTDEVEQPVGIDIVVGDDRDDLLGQHIQRVVQLGDLLDLTFPHPGRDHCRFDQIAAVVGKEDSAGDGADLVPGSADPLQAAGHRRRGLDLDDDVDRAHVDPELE